MAAAREAGVLFASDVHWLPAEGQTEDPTGVFGRFLAEVAGRGQQGKVAALYLIGDLFDFWHERSGRTFDFYRPHLAALKAATATGLAIRLLYGNRDFTYRRVMQEAAGVEILGDRQEFKLGGREVLLQHGDLFCTHDWRYQTYRRIVRGFPARLVLGLIPLAIAARVARSMKRASAAEVARKGERTLRIVDDAVRAEHERGFDLIICGHVHRAERRHIEGTHEGAELITLGAWEGDSGSYVEFDGRRFELKTFPER